MEVATIEINNDSQPRKFVFDHSRLDVHRVLLEALVCGEKLARGLPRGYSTLADPLRRAAQGLAKAEQTERLLELLWRACAMLTQLQRVGR